MDNFRSSETQQECNTNPCDGHNQNIHAQNTVATWDLLQQLCAEVVALVGSSPVRLSSDIVDESDLLDQVRLSAHVLAQLNTVAQWKLERYLAVVHFQAAQNKDCPEMLAPQLTDCPVSFSALTHILAHISHDCLGDTTRLDHQTLFLPVFWGVGAHLGSLCALAMQGMIIQERLRKGQSDAVPETDVLWQDLKAVLVKYSRGV